MIENSNISTFFFGSSGIGFNCYPKSRSYNRYYNSDSIHSWLYEVNYLKTKSVYTYVKYGLLTKIDEGRDGSCFGISIEISNYEFFDPLIILQSLLFSSSEQIIKEEVLMKKLSLSLDIAFIVNEISDQREYLDLISDKVISTLNSKYFDLFIPLENISNSRKGILKVHPNTNNAILNSWKNNYSKILVSPIYEVLENTSNESALIEEQNKNKQLRKINNKLSLKINELENEIKIIQREQEIVIQKENLSEAEIRSSKKKEKKEITINSLLRKDILIPFFFILFVIISTLKLFNSVKGPRNKKNTEDNRINKEFKLKNKLPYWISFDKENHVYLIKSIGFLKENSSSKIKDISDFKKLLIQDLGYYFFNHNIDIVENTDNFQRVTDFILYEMNRSNAEFVPLINTEYWQKAIQGLDMRDYIIINSY